jgi:HptB-dependent secretion and biofilm anti anti-sigma factor
MKIQVPSPFNYTTRRDFFTQISELPVDSELILDFCRVDVLDASALGMLLIAREKVNGSEKRVSLVNCNTNVKQILEAAQFNTLFRIP